MQQHPDETIALLATYIKQSKALATDIWSNAKASMPADPQVSQQAYATSMNFHVKAGLIAVPLAYSDIVATDTIKTDLS